MKHILFVLVLLAACKEQPSNKSKPAPEASRSEACTSALVSFDRFVDTGEDANTPADQRAKVKAVVLDRCIKDNWSEPALTCMRAAKDSHETFKCWNELLTQPQRDAASQALGTLKP